ncbi:MAG: DoxX family protein [Gemmatimonadota bacterium]
MRKRDISLLGLRLVIAGIFLWHGVPKAIDIGAAMDKFAGFDLPGWLGPITGWVEVVASGMLVLGFKHRWAVLALLVIIVGAMVTVQLPRGMSSGLERDALILAGLLVLLAEPRLGLRTGGSNSDG